jgi:hypothetical protein
MSHLTSTARVSPRPLTRPTTTPRLRVVTGAPPKSGGAAFGVICATLLAAGLIALLLLNTTLAQGSFTLHQLQATSDQLTDAEDALTQSLAASKSPANIASKAAGMGMAPAQVAAFLRLSDGRVIGVARPAKPGPGFTVVKTTKSTPETKLATTSATKSATKPLTATAATMPARPTTR